MGRRSKVKACDLLNEDTAKVFAYYNRNYKNSNRPVKRKDLLKEKLSSSQKFFSQHCLVIGEDNNNNNKRSKKKKYKKAKKKKQTLL